MTILKGTRIGPYTIAAEIYPVSPNHPTRVFVLDGDTPVNTTDKRPHRAYLVMTNTDYNTVASLPDEAQRAQMLAHRAATGADFMLPFHHDLNPSQRLNGFLIEDLLAILSEQLLFQGTGPFASRENSTARTKVQEAALWLHQRRMDRIAAQTSGTHKP